MIQDSVIIVAVTGRRSKPQANASPGMGDRPGRAAARATRWRRPTGGQRTFWPRRRARSWCITDCRPTPAISVRQGAIWGRTAGPAIFGCGSRPRRAVASASSGAANWQLTSAHAGCLRSVNAALTVARLEPERPRRAARAARAGLPGTAPPQNPTSTADWCSAALRLTFQRRDVDRRRDAVERHVHDRRHAAGRRRPRRGREALPLGAAGLVDVHVGVDEPRQQHLVVVEVDHLGCGEVGVNRLDGDDPPVGHTDPARHLPGRGHHAWRAEHQVQLRSSGRLARWGLRCLPGVAGGKDRQLALGDDEVDHRSEACADEPAERRDQRRRRGTRASVKATMEVGHERLDRQRVHTASVVVDRLGRRLVEVGQAEPSLAQRRSSRWP